MFENSGTRGKFCMNGNWKSLPHAQFHENGEAQPPHCRFLGSGRNLPQIKMGYVNNVQ